MKAIVFLGIALTSFQLMYPMQQLKVIDNNSAKIEPISSASSAAFPYTTQLDSPLACKELATNLMLAAAKFGDLVTVCSLLEAGVSADCQDAGNLFSPLMFSSWNGNLELASLILTHPSTAEKKDILLTQKSREGRTPLILASMKGHSPLVQLLFAYGATDTLFDAEGRTAFMHASQAGHQQTIDAMREQPNFHEQVRRTVEFVNEHGQTPLSIAAQQKNVVAAKIFLYCGASPVIRDNEGLTPWHYAIQKGSLEIVRLIYNRADESGKNNLQKLLTKKKESPLMVACMHGHTALVEFFLSLKKNMLTEKPDKEGFTALMHAVKGGHIEVLRLLLATEPSEEYLDKVNHEGKAALHLALAAANIACIRLLLNAGADPGIPDGDGLSPVIRAAYEGNKKILRTVLVAHIPTKEEPKKWTELVNQKSRVENHKNECFEGTTALILASRQGHGKLVNALLHCGADTTACDATGKNALQAAEEEKEKAIHNKRNKKRVKELEKVIASLQAYKSNDGIANYLKT